MHTSVVIHGHFYQPPREDPWLDEVEAEPTAAPFHDWNERIERECYRTVIAAHVTKADGRIAGIVNTLEWISFNFGPTLLEWLQRHALGTYQQILAADRASAQRLGHGNAIAQPYHHSILPLASRRDKRTEVRWGIADFKRRFGDSREPLGMWLPETAVDDETLDVLAECGVHFTILAPHQVVSLPPNGLPGSYRTKSGRSIALCIYDGDVSHGVAFGGLLKNAVAWASRMLRPRAAVISDLPRLVSVATDGETYGHHHKFAEMALARLIVDLRERRTVRVENFASFLTRHPPKQDLELVERTSWSCPHGVERWRANCGCRTSTEFPSQAWRKPLRAGLQALAEGLHALFASEGKEHFDDPWQARDAYGAAVGATAAELESLTSQLATRSASLVRARELLEMQRDALRMFTSCAWFFDDIAGIEPRQILKYAARACDLAGAQGAGRNDLEPALLAHLEQALSNDVTHGTGRAIYEKEVRPPLAADFRVAAGVAAARSIDLTGGTATPAAYEVSGDDPLALRHVRTGRDRRLRAKVTSASPSDIHVQVEAEHGEGADVALSLFPEVARRAIRTSLRHQLLVRCLTLEELDLLANGDATLRELAARALVRAIHRLDSDPAALAAVRAHDVLDLLEQLETTIPFDAQSAWWQSRLRVATSADPRVQSLGTRLGFDIAAVARGDGDAA
ncbi:MAG: DUF3536 domain-containing protein [Gemmatimonadaceae bacterium]